MSQLNVWEALKARCTLNNQNVDHECHIDFKYQPPVKKTNMASSSILRWVT